MDMRTYLQLDILEISLFRVIVYDIRPKTFCSLFFETFINLKVMLLTEIAPFTCCGPHSYLDSLFPSCSKIQSIPLGL